MRQTIDSRNTFYIVVGTIIVLIAVPYITLQIARCTWPSQNIANSYVALALIPVGLGILLRGAYPYWVMKRRTVESCELDGLFAEIDHYGASVSDNDTERTTAKNQAENEKEKLINLDRPIVELDALPLRQALVDLYHPEAELIAKTRSELEYLNVYAYSSEQDTDESIANRVNGIMAELESLSQQDDDKKNTEGDRCELQNRLRADLKSLRDTAAWYDRTWAIGEWLRTCVIYWVAATLFVSILVGILPVVHLLGNWNLSIVHWAGLGIAGALSTIFLQLHTIDLPDLGETEGKLLILGTVRRIAIGAMAAILLYAAIWGEALDGKIFPDLPTGRTLSMVGLETDPNQPDTTSMAGSQVDWRLLNVGLSVFWGILAGLSPNVLRRLTRLADNSLGESDSGSSEE